MSIISLMIAISIGAPPQLTDNQNVLQEFEDAGIQIQGRDPFNGTGLCGALLPVHVPSDVYHVSLPVRGFTDDHLRLLRRFPHLIQIRCQRPVTEAEHKLIELNVPTGTWLLYDVRLDTGDLKQRRSFRRGYRLVDEDVNGDGIIDEDDGEILDPTNVE